MKLKDPIEGFIEGMTTAFVYINPFNVKTLPMAMIGLIAFIGSLNRVDTSLKEEEA